MTSAAPPAAMVQPKRALASSPCARTLPLSGVAEGDAAPEAFVAPVVADELVCDVCDDDEAAALVFEREAELSVCPKKKKTESVLASMLPRDERTRSSRSAAPRPRSWRPNQSRRRCNHRA